MATKSKPHLTTVKCECGKQIELIPDITAMSQAIENHATEHKNKETNQQKAEAERIQDNLIKQVLQKAAQPPNQS